MDIIDKVYVIHCVENKERLNNIRFQMDHNKWLKNKLEIYWTCYFPFSNIAVNAMLMSNKSRFLSNKSEYNLAREFYRIIKVAYEREFNSICIFEDDFSLINEDKFNEFLINLPKDFDIVQLSYLFNNKMYDYKILLNKYDNGQLWVEKDFGAWSNNGLILSRNGMKYFIDNMDKEFKAADIPIHESKNDNRYWGKYCQSNKDIKHYIPTKPIVYVDGYDSSVQTNTKDELYELYRHKLKKDDYVIYEKKNSI